MRLKHVIKSLCRSLKKLKGNIIDSTQLSCTEVLVVAKFKKTKFAYDNYFFLICMLLLYISKLFNGS